MDGSVLWCFFEDVKAYVRVAPVEASMARFTAKDLSYLSRVDDGHDVCKISNVFSRDILMTYDTHLRQLFLRTSENVTIGPPVQNTIHFRYNVEYRTVR